MQWDGFLERPSSSIDVLIIGNSHAECTVAPMQLWAEHRLTAWSLNSGGINWPMKSAFVTQALSTHKPQLLAVEAYRVDATSALSRERTLPALEVLGFGVNKVRTIAETEQPGSRIEQALIPFEWRRTSYQELTRSGMGGPLRRALLGNADELSYGGGRILATPPVAVDGDQVASADGPPAQGSVTENLEFARRIAEECRELGIPLLFWLAPIDGDSTQSQLFDEMRTELQREYPEIQFLDMNRHAADIGLEAKDFRDEGHLYAWGMEKATTWFGDYLQRSGLATPRVDVAEASWWNRSAAMWKNDVQAAVRAASQQ